MKNEVISWLEKAGADLRKAKILLEKKEIDGVTFYSQQAVEKALKAVHLFKGLGILRTHDLFVLGRSVELPKELIEKAVLLNPFYTSSRHPIAEGEENVVDEEVASEFLNNAEEIIKWCRQKMKI